jgi:hypothetical protein
LIVVAGAGTAFSRLEFDAHNIYTVFLGAFLGILVTVV